MTQHVKSMRWSWYDKVSKIPCWWGRKRQQKSIECSRSLPSKIWMGRCAFAGTLQEEYVKFWLFLKNRSSYKPSWSAITFQHLHRPFAELNKTRLLTNFSNIWLFSDFRLQNLYVDNNRERAPQVSHFPTEVSGSPSGQESELGSSIFKTVSFPLAHLASRTRGALPGSAQHPRDPGCPRRWMLPPREDASGTCPSCFWWHVLT